MSSNTGDGGDREDSKLFRYDINFVRREGFGWLIGFLTSSSTARLLSGTGPKSERLTNLRPATLETELGDHDFCLSREKGRKVGN